MTDPNLPPSSPPPDADGAAREPAGTGAASSAPVPEPGPGTQPIEGVAFAPEPEHDTPAPGAPAGPPPPAPGAHPTAPVSTRPAVVPRRGGSMTRMGPWAPVAGALIGVLLGVVAVVLLAGVAHSFRERLALVLLVIGLGILGAAGTLLADEVGLVRRGIREAAVRPAWVEATAGLLNGLTPGRLLLLTSGFVLFLAAYVSRG
jgi:hypothetical protein